MPTATTPPALTADARRVVSFYEQGHAERPFPRVSRSIPAMHLGFWDERTGSNARALTNMDRALAERAGIRPGDRVLDAGCGFGRSAVWLAGEFGAEVVGVNLAPGQVYRARRLAYRRGVSDGVTFERKDFARTGFQQESFDVVWALESICHTHDKPGFLAEARRLLKPGGRLVVADFFRSGRPFDAENERLLRSWLSGWAVPDLATGEEFEELVRLAGFTGVRSEDMTANVWPSARRLYRRALVGYPATALLRVLRLRGDGHLSGARSGLEQHQALQRGLWSYGIFTGASAPATLS